MGNRWSITAIAGGNKNSRSGRILRACQCLLAVMLCACSPSNSGLADIEIRKEHRTSRDYVTGGLNEYTDIHLRIDGRAVDSFELKRLINAQHPGLVEYPTVYDAVALAPNDWLLVVSRNSQGHPYPVVRLTRSQGTTRAAVLPIGDGSPYNWFPDSRLEGWTLVRGEQGHNHMVRHQPFALVDIGPGALAKVDYPYAFLADANPAGNDIVLRAVDLNTGQTLARLALGKDCFRLPAFAFDHPKLDRHTTTENDRQVAYAYGPTWWHKNFEFDPGPPARLTLRPDHVLAVPPVQVLALRHDMVDSGPKVQTGAAMPVLLEDDEQLPLMVAQCAALNPRGLAMAQGDYPEVALSLNIAELCLLDGWNIDPAEKQRRCGAVDRKRVYEGSVFSLNDVAFTYRPGPTSTAREAIAVRVPELEIQGQRHIQIDNPYGSGEALTLREYQVLNPDQILLKARGTGAYELFLLQAHAGAHQLLYLETVAYPATPLEALPGTNYLVQRRDRQGWLLFGRVPFSRHAVSGLVAVRDNRVVTLYGEAPQPLRLSVFELSPSEYQGRLRWSGTVASSCILQPLPDVTRGLKDRATWFANQFEWSQSGDEVRLARRPGGDAGAECRVQEKTVEEHPGGKKSSWF